MTEQMTIFDLTRPQYRINKKIRLIELFAGYGSQAMALKRLGVDFEHYRVCEIDRFAVDSYNSIHGTDFVPIDIRNWGGYDLGITDKDRYCYIMFYSFPCTDLSVAGNMLGMAEGSGTRSSLLWEVKRLLEESKALGSMPDILIMENVIAIHNSINKTHFDRWLDFLNKMGYSSYMADMNAADYGIPQHRERTFVVSILGSYNYKFPHPMELDTCVEDYFEDMTEDMAMQYIVKRDVAHKLLVELNDEGALDD